MAVLGRVSTIRVDGALPPAVRLTEAGVRDDVRLVEPAESGMVTFMIDTVRLTVPAKLFVLCTVMTAEALCPLGTETLSGTAVRVKPPAPTITVIVAVCVPVVAVPVSFTL